MKLDKWLKLWAIITQRWFIIALYFIIGVVAPMAKYHKGNWNNIKIFFSSAKHLLAKQDLYAAYPAEHGDYYLYGPVFAAFALPFAFLPSWLGVVLFLALSTVVFLLGVYTLKLTENEKAIFCLICFFDFLTNQQNFQTNAIVAGLILLSLSLVQRNRIIAATFCIAFGMLFKIFGIVGLVMFLFTPKRIKFVAWFAIWTVVLFFVPAVFSSFDFNLSCYTSWIERLGAKNDATLAIAIDNFGHISLFDFVRRTFHFELNQTGVLLGAAALTGCVLLAKWKCWHLKSELSNLAIASALVAIVILSVGAESPTFIILQAGVALWFLYQRNIRPKFALIVLGVMIVFSSLAPTDLFYGEIGEFYSRKGLRALPCTLFWMLLVAEMMLIKCPRKPAEKLS